MPPEEPEAVVEAVPPEPAPEAAPETKDAAPAEPIPDPELAARIEAVLFVSSSPLSPRRLAEFVEAGDTAAVRRVLGELAETYRRRAGALAIEEVAGGFQMMTRPELAPWVQRILEVHRDKKLTPAALETLAVIAYKQPVTRAEIERVRGVISGPLIKQLVDRGFVKVAGRAEGLGRPVQYGTTPEFLKHFGLKSTQDLPRPENLT